MKKALALILATAMACSLVAHRLRRRWRSFRHSGSAADGSSKAEPDPGTGGNQPAPTHETRVMSTGAQ